MKVLVAGANGATGRLLLKKLKENNHSPKAMVRDEAQGLELKDIGADEIVVGDLEGDISLAVKGVEAVIFAAGSGSGTGKDKTDLVDRLGAIRLIDAAEQAGAGRFIMLSAAGVDEFETSPETIRHYMIAKSEADSHLKQSDLTYTIVRPGRLTYEKGTGKIRIAEKLEDRNGSIPREDVAEVMVLSLMIENTGNRVFEILSGDIPINMALRTIEEAERYQ
ncbi:MAG: SDR family oxidoreductase [Balneolales bacterium]